MTDIRSFLGLTGYCWRFIENFSIIVAYLTKLTRMDVVFIQIGDCEKAFPELKDSLATTPVSTILMPGGNLVVFIDASGTRLGRVLIRIRKW